jgi:hypothetical protein
MDVTLRCAGAFTGTVDVNLSSTVGALRATLASRVGAEDVKVIAGGVVLADASRTLESYRVTAVTRLLVTKGAGAAAAVREAEGEAERCAARDARLVSIREAATRFASRELGADSFHVSLERQDGQSFSLGSDSARQAVVTGLVLHSHGRKMLARRDYAEAAGSFALACDAFDEAPAELMAGIDNAPQAALDWCWAVFLQNDVSQLQQGVLRLRAAREGLARAHGADLQRLRTLVSSAFAPQLLAHARLNILEAVVAWHSGDVATASSKLEVAQEHLRQFHVDSDAHAHITAMGFSSQEATRGLRHCSGTLSQAVDWLIAQRGAAEERKKRHDEERHKRRRLRGYGQTRGGKAVEEAALQRLVSLDFSEDLAAAALLDADNVFEAALDALVDPQRRDALQDAVIRKRKRQTGRAASKQLVEMGFSAATAASALKQCDYDSAAAAELLLSGALVEPDADAAAEVDPAAAGPSGEKEEDREVEAELAAELKDPMQDYDVDISCELGILNNYLARVANS